MKFVSTNNPLEGVGFKEAVMKGLASDGGLFVPANIPVIEERNLKQIEIFTFPELAFNILSEYVSEDLTENQLWDIICDTFQFKMPVVEIPGSQVRVLELFHGPTWAFKDAGARFLSGCLSAWNKHEELTTILVATSGDTGGAVANGFYNQQGIRVVILYPKGKISPLQEQQIAGLGGNITAVAVEGSFDDCQTLVKKVFNDKELRKRIKVTSANSINLARWLPQMVFYGIAWREMQILKLKPTICIPSGNFGNISAALLAHKMGFSFETLIAAHNANDTVPRFLRNGVYEPLETIGTYANAMDVSDPSNFSRFQYLLAQNKENSNPHFLAESVSDEKILQAIRDVWSQHHYLLDPHTATAWQALMLHGASGLIVSTAHPSKFEDIILKGLGHYPDTWRKSWKHSALHTVQIKVDYKSLQEILTG